MTGFARQSALIVFALEAETQWLFSDGPLLICGVGKFNATYRLARVLGALQQQNKKPSVVLNLGSAGSPTFKVGEVVNCTKFIQRDMDTTAFGTPAFATPSDIAPAIMENGLRFDAFPEGVCGSGDSFVTDKDATEWNVVDMEAYALAKVCFMEKMPFGCLKYITDGSDSAAAESWDKAVQNAADALKKATQSILS